MVQGMARLFESFCEGKVVVVRDPLSHGVPLFCKLCDFPMITSDDCISHRKIGVCSRCSGRWEHTRGSQLADGIFPDKTSEAWVEYMEERKATAVRIIDIR